MKKSTSEKVHAPPNIVPMRDCSVINAPQRVFDSNARVHALFSVGALVETSDTQLAWSTFLEDTTELVTFADYVSRNLLHVDVFYIPESNLTVLASVHVVENSIYIYSCLDGAVLSIIEFKNVNTIDTLSLSDTWILATAQHELGTAIITRPWRNFDFISTEACTTIQPTSIKHVSRTIFDKQLKHICWILSASGVFSVDVTLPLNLIAPVMITLDPMKEFWDFSLEYRNLVFNHHALTSKYHSGTYEEKLNAVLSPAGGFTHEYVLQMRAYPHMPIKIEHIPLHISCLDESLEYRMIFTSQFVVCVDLNDKKLSQIPLPPYLCAVQVCSKTFCVMTTSYNIMFITYTGGNFETSTIQLPPATTSLIGSESHCMVPINSTDKDTVGVHVHLKGNIIYTIELSYDSNHLYIKV